MELILTKKPKNPIIVEGFPGLGFVGTIATEYLLEHLHTESIGYFWSDKMLPMAAVHAGKVRRNLEIFHSKKENIVFVHALNKVSNIEWDLAASVIALAKELKAKQIVSLEGVGSPFGAGQQRTFFQTNNSSINQKLAGIGLQELKEGVIMGVTGSIMLTVPKTLPAVFMFAETHSNLPDSKAAAELIKALDSYLGLKVDYKPLIKESEKVQEKLKELMQKGQQAQKMKEKKDISYLG